MATAFRVFPEKFLSQRGFDISRGSQFVNFFGIGDATIFYRPAKFSVAFTEINIREFIFKIRALDFSFEITHDIFSPIYNGESIHRRELHQSGLRHGLKLLGQSLRQRY